MIEKPKLSFSKWFKWEDKGKYPDKKYPGVYMVAITDKNLEGTDPQLDDVVYIGMTNSWNGLIGRWRQFDRSIKGFSGHSGGNTVYADLGDYKNWTKKLFVCGSTVKCTVDKKTRTPDDLLYMGWVAYLEYEALAYYKTQLGKEPLYNKK